MMELTSDFFDIRCAECGERITIYKDDLDIEDFPPVSVVKESY